jgi:hypothetical protein
MTLLGRILFNVFIWAGSKLFAHVDVRTDDDGRVISMLFFNEEKSDAVLSR